MIDLPAHHGLWLPPKPAIIRPSLERPPKLAMPWTPGFCMPQWPTKIATATTTIATNATTFTANLPASTTNDLLLVFVCINRLATSVTLNTPSGWTARYNVVNGANIGACFFKLASGSDGTTLALTNSGSLAVSWMAISYRIGRWATATPPESATATGTSTTPTPITLTVSWITLNTLWFAAESDNSSNATAVAIPTSYIDSLSVSSTNGGTVQGHLTVCRRQLATTSTLPGAFTIGSSAVWVAAAVAVRPH